MTVTSGCRVESVQNRTDPMLTYGATPVFAALKASIGFHSCWKVAANKNDEKLCNLTFHPSPIQQDLIQKTEKCYVHSEDL